MFERSSVTTYGEVNVRVLSRPYSLSQVDEGGRLDCDAVQDTQSASEAFWTWLSKDLCLCV
jgi:hypothetical protein